jgi:hypothetical protein
MTQDPGGPPIDPSTAHPARRYNYWLGGKDNFAADRASGDAIEQIYPHIRTAAIENRRFLHRVVRYLAAEAGIRQFLDIGTGLPTADNTHEIAQGIHPTCRIVYVDNDPLVLAHARALLTSHPTGATDYIHADLRDPERILAHPAVTDTLDLDQPVALLLIAVLHFLPDTEQAYAAVKTLTEALAAGSYLALSHATDELLPAHTAQQLRTTPLAGAGDFTSRTRQQISHFLDGLHVLPPGMEIISQWRRELDDPAPPAPEQVAVYGAVGRKPSVGSRPSGRDAGPPIRTH